MGTPELAAREFRWLFLGRGVMGAAALEVLLASQVVRSDDTVAVAFRDRWLIGRQRAAGASR